MKSEITTETVSNKDITFRFVDEIVFPGDRTMYYFSNKEEYITLLKSVQAVEAWVDNRGDTYAEMTNGAVFVLKNVKD